MSTILLYPPAVLDDFRLHLCVVSDGFYGRLCRHDLANNQEKAEAQRKISQAYETLLRTGEEALKRGGWDTLYQELLAITSHYYKSDEPSEYAGSHSCKTRAEEIATAAIGVQVRKTA